MALRYLRSRKKAGISLTSLLTVVGFAVGVAALTVVTSVWNGFAAEFLDKLLGINAHSVVLRRHDVFRSYTNATDQLQKAPGISHVAPFVYSEVIAQSAKNVQGLAIKGIDPSRADRTPLARYISKDPKETQKVFAALAARSSTVAGQMPGIVLGKDLTEILHVKVGEVITIISPYGGNEARPKTQPFYVVGTFHSGMYEFDSRMVFIDLREAQRFFRLWDTVTGLEVWSDDPMTSKQIIRTAVEALDPDDPLAYESKDWSDTNRGIFGAMRQQKVLIVVVLAFIVLVAAFMIMATLILLILEKGREVAILKALGATDGSILRIFVLDGQIIGIAGCLLGIGLGLVTCAILEKYGLKLDPRVYYLERLPVEVNPIELTVVCVGAMILATLATIFPALKAAKMSPVDGLTKRTGVRAAERATP